MNSRFTELHYIDSHTGGEPTRVIHDGYPALEGATVAEKLAFLRTHHDWVRSAAVNEPRGSDAIVGAILLPASHPQVDAGVIFFNNTGYIHMCVHGTIGLAVTLAHLGRLPDTGIARLETPVGNVTATLRQDNTVTVANVPSFRCQAGVTLEVPEFGTVIGDVAWGGNWFFLVERHALAVEFPNIAALTRFCTATRQALARAGISGSDGGEIDHIEVFASPSAGIDADSQNFVLCPGGAYDRSPCGTGTSAKLACLHADGKLAPGDTWRQAGIVGSVFSGTIAVAGDTLIPHISGSAFITGAGRLLIDANDPFRHGIPGAIEAIEA